MVDIDHGIVWVWELDVLSLSLSLTLSRKVVNDQFTVLDGMLLTMLLARGTAPSECRRPRASPVPNGGRNMSISTI